MYGEIKYRTFEVRFVKTLDGLIGLYFLSKDSNNNYYLISEYNLTSIDKKDLENRYKKVIEAYGKPILNWNDIKKDC